MSTKGRITYRFDKQSGARVESPRQETQRASGADGVPYFQEEMKFTSDIGSWNSPFQNDAGALEQLIREADGQLPKRQPKPGMREQAEAKRLPIDTSDEELMPLETHDTILLGDEDAPYGTGAEAEFDAPRQPYSKRAAAPQVIDMYPQIELDDELERYNHPGGRGGNASFGSSRSGAGKRPAQGPSWFKVFASVAGAIATGALFGYFVLTLFTGGGASDETDSAGSVPAVSSGVTGTGKTGTGVAEGSGGKTSSNAAGAKGDPKGTGNSTGEAASGSVKIDVPAASYYMLQYGVFSSKDGLTTAAAELHNKGLAAASLTSGNDFRIYVGMTTDRNAADLLGQTLTGMDVYVKQVDLPALNSMVYSGKPADVQTFFEDTSGLLAKLDDMTVSRLSGQTGTLDKDWQALHEQWTESASRLESGMTDGTNKAPLLKLIQAVNSAAVAAGEYAKKPSETYLWSMQTALMNAVFIQKDWFASIESL